MSRPNSSNWRDRRSCTATPNGLPSCTACCGACSATTTCWTSRPTPTSQRLRRWPQRFAAIRTGCRPLSAFARSDANRHRISSPGWNPEHHIVAATAAFFASRFADMPWSILTPDVCAHWDGHAVAITPGVANAGAPTEDRLEETWRSYYANIFNPARLKVKAMQTETPKNTGGTCRSIVDQAPDRRRRRADGAMIANAATEPPQPQKRRITDEAPTAAYDTLAALRGWTPIAAPVRFGKTRPRPCSAKARSTRRIMLVGEQPGDKEDLAGKPFVGPAGRCSTARWRKPASTARRPTSPTRSNISNSWPGKIRLHQKPNTPEIKACRPWYERELAAIKPDWWWRWAPPRRTMRVRQDHADQQEPRPPDRSRRGTKALVTVHRPICCGCPMPRPRRRNMRALSTISELPRRY